MEKHSFWSILGILMLVLSTAGIGVYIYRCDGFERSFKQIRAMISQENSVPQKVADQKMPPSTKFGPVRRDPQSAQKSKLYSWVDEKGVRHYSDRKPTGTVDDLKITKAFAASRRGINSSVESAAYISRSSRGKTQVIIDNNTVLVPVILKNQDRKVSTFLVIDTGASTTTIHRDLANELSIWRTKPSTSVVADGRKVATARASIESIYIGPYCMNNLEISIIDYEGSERKSRGLLGMNFLKHVKFDIDFKNQTISWRQE